MPPLGHERNTRFTKFNHDLMSSSAGMLPQYNDLIKGCTVTCGHTSQGFRAIDAGCPSDDARFTIDGRLSISVLADNQPKYAAAVRDGVEWDAIDWEVEDVFTWIPKLLQEAGNAGQQIARCESRIEVMLKVQIIANRIAGLDQHGVADWDRVQKESARGGAPFASELHGLVMYVKELSGGLEDPVLLFEYRDFTRQLQTQRIVKGHMYQALADVQISSEGACPLFRMAMAKSMSSASEKYARGDEQNLFKTSDITSLSKPDKKGITFRAEDCLVEVRKLLEVYTVPEPARTTLLGLVDTQVVHFVTNKPDDARGTFNSLNDIGASFAQHVSDLLQKDVKSPWKADAAVVATKRDANPEANKANVFTNTGKWSNSRDVLTRKGINVGVSVKHVASNIVYKVKTVSDTTAALVTVTDNDDTSETSHAHNGFLDGTFVVFVDARDRGIH